VSIMMGEGMVVRAGGVAVVVTKVRNGTERNGTVPPTKIRNARNGTVTEQWRLQGRAYPGIARVFLHTIYYVICLNVLHAHVYRVRRHDVARGHGLWRSQVNLKSVEARSVHSHLCLPGLLLVSAGASVTEQSGLVVWLQWH